MSLMQVLSLHLTYFFTNYDLLAFIMLCIFKINEVFYVNLVNVRYISQTLKQKTYFS